jgi:hypothetical protein
MQENRLRGLAKFVCGLCVVAAIFAVVALEWRGLARIHFIGYDYAFFYYAFQAILHHHTAWGQLYNLPAEQALMAHYGFPILRHNQYVYPPQFACLFAPLGLLPFRWSAYLWMLSSTVLYYCTLYWLACVLWGQIRRAQLIVTFLLASVMTPFQVDIGVGNINSFLLAATSLTFYLLYKKKDGYAGIPLGLAVLSKVTPAAILMMLVLRKRWKTALWTAGTIACATLVTALIVGVTPILQYIIHFSSFGHTSMKNGPAPYNQSILGVLGLLQAHGSFVISAKLQFVIYLVFISWVAWLIYTALQKAGERDERMYVALTMLTPVAFSPLIEEAHMLFVLPALMLFAYMAREAYALGTGAGRRRAVLLATVVGVCALLLSLPATFAVNDIVHRWPQWYFLHARMFCALVIILFTFTWLYRRPLPGMR